MKVMKYLWFKDVYGNIWKITEDYFYVKIYYKDSNYTESRLWDINKNGFNNYTLWFKLKEISEADAFLEVL